MFQDTVSTTIPLMAVVYSRAMPITTLVMFAPISMCQTALGQLNVVLPPQLIPGDTVRGSATLTTMPQQQQPQFWMTPQTYASYAMDPLQVSSPSELSLLLVPYVLCWCLLWC